MPGLRFFACDRCGTVYAGPVEPPGCDGCGNDRLEEITGRVQGGRYFAPPDDGE